MNNIMKQAWLFAACVALAGCAKKEEPARFDRDIVTQVSLLRDFQDGDYAGKAGMDELLRYGKIGIGSLDSLDGEMMVLGGEVFRFAANGDASKIALTNTTPSATVTYFDTDAMFDVGAMDDTIFHKTMDWKRPADVQIVAFRMTGLFDVVQTRSVPRQNLPFLPLGEVAASTVSSEWHDTVGTMVGFYFPDARKEINWPGYHLHFIDEGRKHGGHVLSFRLRQGRIELDFCNGVQMLTATNSVQTL